MNSSKARPAERRARGAVVTDGDAPNRALRCRTGDAGFGAVMVTHTRSMRETLQAPARDSTSAGRETSSAYAPVREHTIEGGNAGDRRCRQHRGGADQQQTSPMLNTLATGAPWGTRRCREEREPSVRHGRGVVESVVRDRNSGRGERGARCRHGATVAAMGRSCRRHRLPRSTGSEGAGSPTGCDREPVRGKVEGRSDRVRKRERSDRDDEELECERRDDCRLPADLHELRLPSRPRGRPRARRHTRARRRWSRRGQEAERLLAQASAAATR